MRSAAPSQQIVPVIMAGGAGTRLWPLSTEAEPKQFLALVGPRSTFAQTLARLADSRRYAPPVVITGGALAGPAASQLARTAPGGLMVLEPCRRDSAAAVAVATVLAARQAPETLVLVLAADHLIDGDAAFHAAIDAGATAAAAGAIVVFGIRPEGPATAYGYIRPGAPLAGIADGFALDAFIEKPDAEGAARLIADGCLWNSGNFLFRADAMAESFRRHAPDILAGAEAAIAAGRTDDAQALHLDPTTFAAIRRISFDYAVMEKVKPAAVISARFGWSDVGSWDAVWQALPHDPSGNAVAGDAVLRDATGCLVHAGAQTVVAAGVRDLAIVATADNVLVVPRARSQEVKAIAEAMAERAPAATFPQPVTELPPGAEALETLPLVKPSGFREYDARWWFGHGGSPKRPELNLMGAQALGLGLGTFLHECGAGRDIVTGHDFRSYSQAIKLALVNGLAAAGARVHDIGLAITPIAYFAQFALDVPAVAMVTASHNENGWTGVKMGAERPLTFGPAEMRRLKEIVLSGRFRTAPGGSSHFVAGMAARYVDDLTARAPFTRKLKVVVACGNGTAGAFAPAILEKLGCEVVPLHCRLDHSFPHYNPNPEDLGMLADIAGAVRAAGADLGLGFDGDGDRCGVVDERGSAIFADKVGLMLARDLAQRHRNARFVVDVKSTGLFATDEVLASHGAATDYFKTGHSYIKRRVQDLGALAGFEKSGHYFFNAPEGRGYDDGMVTAIAVLAMLDRNPKSTMSDLYRALPLTWGSPTMSAHCADEVKYDVVARVTARLTQLAAAGGSLAGQAILSLNTVNGVRAEVADGTWGLVRASSNKPEIVVVVESPVSEGRLGAMFAAVDAVLRENPEVGAYNQTL